MASPTDLNLGIGVDTREFHGFARALRKAHPDLSRLLMLRLRSVGEVVAEEARHRAQEFSAHIAASIKVRVSGASVSVVAGGRDVPLAGLFELGSAGNRGASSVFKHPVFGNRATWADQPTHPFLAPTVRDKAEAVERAAVEALDEVIAKVVGGDV